MTCNPLTFSSESENKKCVSKYILKIGSTISNKPGYKSCHITLLASTLIFPAKPKEKRQASNKQATCCSKLGSRIEMLSIVIPPLV